MAAIILTAAPQWAEAASKPDFRIAVKALRVGGAETDTSTSENGATTEQNDTSIAIETFPDSFELAAFLDSWAIYTYPGQSSASLMVGYSGWSGFEVGPQISVRYSKHTVKDGGKTTSSKEGRALPGSPDRNLASIGAYLYYGQPLGTTAAWVIETTLSGWYGKQSGSERVSIADPSGASSGSTTINTSLDGDSLSLSLEAVLAVALADKFEYAPGVAATYIKGNTKGTRQTGSTYDIESATFAWELTLAKFRYTF